VGNKITQLLQNIFNISQNLIIRKTNHGKSVSVKFFGSFAVIIGDIILFVVFTIRFNDQFQLVAIKVSDKFENGMLPSEF